MLFSTLSIIMQCQFPLLAHRLILGITNYVENNKDLLQTTLRVLNSPVVDKNLPPDNFYLAKVPNSGQFPVADKKIWDIYYIFCSFLWQFVVHCHAYICHSNNSFSSVSLLFDETSAQNKSSTTVENHSSATTVTRISYRRTTR